MEPKCILCSEHKPAMKPIPPPSDWEDQSPLYACKECLDEVYSMLHEGF